ncbi:pantoate--beta-alanine ligase [Syntrophorhabdus aromaticivorans]|jgi:pantoate--beta-alanine ligase|uniref:Pantothenate synthetase n=1 Tax=Syntrophorhabdus aromaticivorans TaxID=328301 RepID=A0A351U2M6_9BACT|nr:pantoate--beta-alanine ligase [Syntrophorhabdus aromaticivorans]HBA54207.1 pantoate--beta-alanine ligase [Syntrophorhabdus aromaticivorans]
MRTIVTVKEMQALSDELRKDKRIAFVPTMGYLHEGHLALARKARELADIVAVSIFINPTQFGPQEDLAKYPRDFDRDAKLLEQEKTDIIFYPDAKEMYPQGYATYVQVRELQNHLCGKSRVGHFVGVATVVAKLFNIVKPHFAVFGQKDYQQLKVIERMVRDLNMDLEIVPYPTVREKDGLAMSSRNAYLNPEEREKALLIYEAMTRVESLVRSGVRDASKLRENAEQILTSRDGVTVEYVSIADTDTLEEVDQVEHKALLAIACHVGKTRLIDNTILEA